MTNKTISLASKKTVALLVAAASLGIGTIAGTAAFAVTGDGADKVEAPGDATTVAGTAPSQDYAARDGVFTASTGEVDKTALTDGKAETSYKSATADSYWVQVDLGKARSLTNVTVKFLANAKVTGFIQYSNAENPGADSQWTDFAKLDGQTGEFTKTAGGDVAKARYVRVLVNKTESTATGANAPTAADVAGVADFSVRAATVFADRFEVSKDFEEVHDTHVGEQYKFTTKVTPADADVHYVVDAPSAFDVEQGKTDADGTTHWTLTVKHSTSGVDLPVTITNDVVKATNEDGTGDKQVVLEQNFNSWDYAGKVVLAASGDQTLFIGDTANGGKGKLFSGHVQGRTPIKDADGNIVGYEAAKQDVVASSDNPAVVSVDKNDAGEGFYVKGLTVGSAKVTAKAVDVPEGETVEDSLNYVSQYHSATGFDEASIKAPSEIVLGSKGKNKVTATVLPADTANQDIDFKSSDEKTLTVDGDGNLTAHVEGLGNGDSKTVTITGTAKTTMTGEEPKTFTVEVTVRRPYVKSVTVDSGLKNGEITLGDATEKGISLKATVSPEFANPALTWASSNTKVATVDEAGNVKFTGEPGLVVFTATSTHGAGADKAPVVGSTAVNVVRPKLTGLTAYKAGDAKKTPVKELSFTLGEENTPVDLDVAASPKYASDSVYWITGDATVADVDAKTGVVTPHETEGTTTVTAVSTVDGTIQARVNVAVKAPAATKIAVTAPEGFDPATVKVGDKFQLTAAVTPALAHQDVKWTSSDESVATVDANGDVTALKEGNVKITAASTENDKVADSVDIVVNKAEDTDKPDKPETDAFANVKATYTDADGKTVDVEGFDASKDGEYTLPDGVTLDKVSLATDGLDTKIAYTADGKAVEEASKADTAVYTVTDGKTTRVYTFKAAEKPAEKTVKVTLKQNNGLEGEAAGKLQDVVKEFKAGDHVEIVDPTLVDYGYTFEGWSLTADGTELINSKDFTVPEEDTTIYAVWKSTSNGTDDENGENGDSNRTPEDKDQADDKVADDKKATDSNKDGAADKKSGDGLASTGAAVGVIAAVTAALAGAGVTLRKTSKRD